MIRYCVAGEVRMDKHLCGVCSNGYESKDGGGQTLLTSDPHIYTPFDSASSQIQ